MRVLKLLKGPNPGDTVTQKEGELLKKYNPVKNIELVWKLRFPARFLGLSSLKLLEDTYLPKGPA